MQNTEDCTLFEWRGNTFRASEIAAATSILTSAGLPSFWVHFIHCRNECVFSYREESKRDEAQKEFSQAWCAALKVGELEQS